MFFPASADFMLMPPDEFDRRIQSPISEAVVLCQLNFRLNPKLRFSLSMMHMHAHEVPPARRRKTEILSDERLSDSRQNNTPINRFWPQ
jgi:hypothetical protein